MSTAPALPRERPDWDDLRAFLCLLLVMTGASLVLLFAEQLTVGPAYIFFGLSADQDLETPFRVVVPSVLLLLAAGGLRIFRTSFGLGRLRAFETLSAFPAGVGAVALLILGAMLSGVAMRIPDGPYAAGAAMALLGILLTMLQVASEEVLLRGLLQPLLVRAWGPALGIALAAATFAVVHFAGGWRNPLSLFNIALAGVWFGLLAWRTGGIFAPALAHFGYNWSEEMIFGASPNPGVSSYGSAIDFDLSGPWIWGGSEDGFNASIVLTLLLVLLILPLALRLPLRRSWKDGAAA